jgi:DNA ligase (NAD+)
MSDDIKTKIEELRKAVEYHNYLYYTKADPEISDATYDGLYRDLLHLEAAHPEYHSPDSPTQKVGGKPYDYSKNVRHKSDVLSLDKAYCPYEVTDFFMLSKSRAKHYTREEFSHGYVVEPKFDGITLVLKYKDGMLVQALTRGDGFYGSDVTHIAREIDSIPKVLKYEVQNLIVRGEAVILKDHFAKMNESRRLAGLPAYKTTRNLAAGSFGQVDADNIKQRNIQFYAYEIAEKFYDKKQFGKLFFIYNGGMHRAFIIKTHAQSIKFLQKLGFLIPDISETYGVLNDIYEACCKDEFYSKLRNLPYDIDGFVIKINSLKLRNELGIGTTYPYWQMAFKLPQTKHKTVVRSIEWGIGKTGAITPVAIFDPVTIDGTSVARATLHNLSEIGRLGLKIGHTVLVEKAGGIIPSIVEVIDSTHKEKCQQQQDIVIPSICPMCGGSTEVKTGQLFCVSDSCVGTFSKRLLYFVGKKCLDIDGFGDKLCRALVDNGTVSRLSDVFTLTTDAIKPIVGKKNAEKLIAELNNKRAVSLSTFIGGLQIPNVGQAGAKQLADHFKTIDAFRIATAAQILKIDNFGEITAQSVHNYLRLDETQEELDTLLNHLSIKEPSVSDKLKGTFCITGTLSQSRKYFEDLISRNGGILLPSISKKLNFLLAGSDAGSKLDKAKELNIQVISEQELFSMLQ